MVAFGDSLTDGGTRAYFPQCSNNINVFCNNPRVGDGPLLVDYLAANFNVGPLEVGFPGANAANPPELHPRGGSNFARSGAFAREPITGIPNVDQGTEHFSDQIKNYKAAIIKKGDLAPPTKSRLHVVWIGSNDYISALVFRMLLLTNKIPDISVLRRPSLVSLGVAGIEKQLQELLDMDDVCDVLVLGPTDGSRVPVGVLLDSKYPEYKEKYGATIVEDVRSICVDFNQQLDTMIATKFATKFHDKCRENNRGFGIQFFKTVELIEEAFSVKKYPRDGASCNTRNRTKKDTCNKANGVFFSLTPNTNPDSDGICNEPVAAGTSCDCAGFMHYDELQVSGEFHEKLFKEVLKHF
ncbi:hypothetical protein ACA910_007399 [Epithemia clementina (nom. ined.)]